MRAILTQRKNIRVAIYLRISDDREGAGLGVERQRQDCEALAKQLGWIIADIYIDNDISAYTGKPRPEYLRMLNDIRDGRVDAVIAWHTDRLHRRPIELEEYITACEPRGVPTMTVKAGSIDLATPSGRAVARTLGAWARFESEHKSERIRRKVQELAEAGAIANGGYRPFGFRRIYGGGEGTRRKILRDEIDEDEAEIIRECIRRTLDGESGRSIVGWLNRSGIKTSTGRLWTMQALRFMLRSGRIAGLREHRREVIGKAVWPAIIDEETHRQLRIILDNKQRPAGYRARCYYLSGFVYCSRCQIRMKTSTHHGRIKYICPPRVEGGCNGRVIDVEGLETLIGRYMVARLSDPKTLRELAQREAVDDDHGRDLIETIEADERRITMLQAAMVDGDEDEMPEVLASLRVIRKRLTAARVELANLSRTPGILRESLPDLAERWDGLSLERKQALLRLFVSQVVIGPGKRGMKFDPGRVSIVPR